MSFYDLTKDFVLSAKELFKYRGKRNSTLPSRGGQKDFEPDESWLQSKSLEMFMQERTSVLAEPRVEKLKNLVKGYWDSERGLINVDKPGKFWAHMGFTDKRRNWLYPEEALFLMESNTLEVYHGGVPLSIQEAYNTFLGLDVSIEQYQVFSHLRRLGFVVLRHENQPVITPYERQINLDKYISKKSCKDRAVKLKKGKSLKHSVQSNGTNNLNHNSAKTSEFTTEPDSSFVNIIEDEGKSKEEDSVNFKSSKDVQAHENHSSESCSKGSSIEVEKCSSETDPVTKNVDKNNDNSKVDCHESDISTSVFKSKQRKRPMLPEMGSTHDSSKRSCLDNELAASSNSEFSVENVTDVHPALTEDCSPARRFYESSWELCFITKSKMQSPASHNTSDATLETIEASDLNLGNTDIILENGNSNKNVCIKTPPLPNIADTEMLVLNTPSPQLLPEHVEIEERQELLNFDVGKYRMMHPSREVNKKVQRLEERQKQVQGLEFSLPKWMQNQPKLPAANWKEYKYKLLERIKEISKTTPVDHLWKGKVTPLLHPGQSWSHQSILDQLSIIKSADNETLLPDSDCVVDVNIAYDVHLPDSRFKKSMPGIPNHRVCVSKCLSDLPGLAEIHQVWSRFKDNVPLHWAVVDSGEIAFYAFNSNHTSKVFL